MLKGIKRVAVTGGSGQIAYNLLFRIASGGLFGADQPIALNILDVPLALEALKGVVMELEDCSFPLLQEINIGVSMEELFEDVNYAILVGSKPRGPGMKRNDLIRENSTIFVDQGKALNRVAAKDVLVFVVGNPCNTNCLIAMHNAPDIPKNQFCAMTRLDQNRAYTQLALKANVLTTDVDKVIIWGNHSATQVPDFINATINNQPVSEVIKDRRWLETTFIETIQKRGAAVIKARGKSSAASAANAIIDGIHSYTQKSNHLFSSGIWSDNNPYNIHDGLVFSFPCKWNSKNKVEIVPGFEWDEFLEAQILRTEQELLEERDLVSHLL